MVQLRTYGNSEQHRDIALGLTSPQANNSCSSLTVKKNHIQTVQLFHYPKQNLSSII